MFQSLKKRINNFFENKALILMYHQVCERQSDPWELAVTKNHFDEHLKVLKEKFTVVPLEEIACLVRSKKLTKKIVAITFDDGFEDNYTNAKPLLKSRNLPATFYCTTHATQSGQFFWWEELESIILHCPELPKELSLKINEQPFEFHLNKHQHLTKQLVNEIKHWNASMHPTNERLFLFIELWKALKPLKIDLQLKALRELKAWAGVQVLDLPHRVMNVNQLTELSADPLFNIGAHTVHHAMLGEHPLDQQAFEVNRSKSVLQQWIKKEVHAFSYPYGNFNASTKVLLRDAGFQYAVSTVNKAVTAHDDPYDLPRVHVKNWNGKLFRQQLQNVLA